MEKIKEMCNDEVLIYLEESFVISEINHVWALAKHLDLTTEDLQSIDICTYDNSYFSKGYIVSYKKNEYYVCTNKEADRLSEEIARNIIDEGFISYVPENIRYIVEQYIDYNRWVDDMCQDRGDIINKEDGVEYSEIVNNKTYYIYNK